LPIGSNSIRFPICAPQTRSYATELHENIKEIERWRASPPERKRRLLNPQSIVKRWRKETQPHAQQVQDGIKAAAYAWRHFVELMEPLPADQAAPLWQAAYMQAMKSKRIRYLGNLRIALEKS
jgi:hypothetical protein